MQRTTTGARPLNAKINHHSDAADTGRGGQIDWGRVSPYFFNIGKFTVKLAATVGAGDEVLTVDALPYPLKKGANLDFGRYLPVEVELSAQAAAGATSLAVLALDNPIPAGTVLDFTGAGEFAKTDANAAAGATSISVEALDAQIESGDTANFLGGAINAEVTSDVDAGETAVPVEPLPFGILDNAEAIATQGSLANAGRKIPAFTTMARTADDKLIPRRDADEETAIEFLASDADEMSKTDAKTGYGTYIRGGFYENLLPDADADGNLPSGWKTELGNNFWFADWRDSSSE